MLVLETSLPIVIVVFPGYLIFVVMKDVISIVLNVKVSVSENNVREETGCGQCLDEGRFASQSELYA